jgi:integrase
MNDNHELKQAQSPLKAVNDPSAPERFVRAEVAAEFLGINRRLLLSMARRGIANTIPIVKHNVMDYLVARWGEEIANDIKPFEIQKWLLSLRNERGLAWSTISKLRGIMLRSYKVGILHERVSKNPVLPVETRSKSNYKAITINPAQTVAIVERLSNPLHYALVVTAAATALRSSELISLRWSDILWQEGRIRISKRWAKGADGDTKTWPAMAMFRCTRYSRSS